jgi:hypothetical protein
MVNAIVANGNDHMSGSCIRFDPSTVCSEFAEKASLFN